MNNWKAGSFLLLLFVVGVWGQVKTGTGFPKSFTHIRHNFTALLVEDIDTLTFPPVDDQLMLDEDEKEMLENKLTPIRVGVPHPANDVGIDTVGTWTLDGNTRVWRLKLVCPNAYAVSVTYSWWHLAADTSFFVYDEARTLVLGPFTSKNNKDRSETFATQPVPGTTIILEYNQPASLPQDASGLQIQSVTHYYRNLFKTGTDKAFGGSGSCNHDVACDISGFDVDAYSDQIRSVAMILLASQSRLCTGALINNHKSDCKPLFLTAAHCLTGDVGTWLFWFNHQRSTCKSSEGFDAIPKDSITGATLLASGSSSDFALLELKETPPEDYDVYYSGWNAGSFASTAGTCIHHPTGDVKKISFTTQLATGSAYGTNHVRIPHWDKGTTQGGSSGSPLFDSNKRIIGQLHGGSAMCGPNGVDNTGWDEFGGVDFSFDGATGCESCGTTPSACCNTLKPFLAGSSSITSLSGRDHC